MVNTQNSPPTRPPGSSSPLRSLAVLTNMRGLKDVHLSGAHSEVTLFSSPPRSLAGMWKLSRQLDNYDYALVNCAPRDLLRLVMAASLNPFSRCRIISLDTVLPVPRKDSAARRAVHRLKILAFKRVHLFIEYFRDVRGYERHYGIPKHKFRYVPFKINRYEKVLATPTRDEGYIFCGGNTRRDFATLIEAVRGTPYPVRIVTMDDQTIEINGSRLDESNLPPNVRIVRHDGSESFVDHIAGARLVALPIRKENISASGIGVYLASMGLGKCVIISHGPAVDGVVPEGAAIIVPPEDVAALREAIERAWNDEAYRSSVAAKGREYARSLEGEARLCESVMNVLLEDKAGRVGDAATYAGAN